MRLSKWGVGCTRLPGAGGNDAAVGQAALDRMAAYAMARLGPEQMGPKLAPRPKGAD